MVAAKHGHASVVRYLLQKVRCLVTLMVLVPCMDHMSFVTRCMALATVRPGLTCS